MPVPDLCGVEQAQDAGDRDMYPVGAVVLFVAQLVERFLQLAGRQQCLAWGAFRG